jgi:porphobilinogen synthase
MPIEIPFLPQRGRRLRLQPGLRAMVRETRISPEALILPLFLEEGRDILAPIPSLPGQYRYSPDRVGEGIRQALDAGVSRFLLFGIPRMKDALGSQAYAEDGIVQQCLAQIRRDFGRQVYLITDICMCEYTDHGHCGVLDGETVDNDRTLAYLARIALSHARAGADMAAPSDMMDGRVAALRRALDEGGFSQLPIMSYAVKYASAFYGPFREAAGSAPGFGDRKSYQMDFHNQREALKEADADAREGADIIMVKPALAYLDIIRAVAAESRLPVAAYSVSGEYAMIKAAAAANLIDEYGVMTESAVAVFRAGADILITYYAKELAQAIRKGDIG